MRINVPVIRSTVNGQAWHIFKQRRYVRLLYSISTNKYAKKILSQPPFSLTWKIKDQLIKSWQHAPPETPDQTLLALWQQSEWPEYRQHITQHSLTTISQWHKLRGRKINGPPISIITPVFNTSRHDLVECILSVRLQTLPRWELILTDDGSQRAETLDVLASRICRDPRITILRCPPGSAHGISAASNRAVSAASGDYILFLDHDDRLALDALQTISAHLADAPETDLIYSDKDMLSQENRRFMHLFKPDWSPETLLSCNYLIHILCLRKTLFFRAGGLRSEYDGSQDLDLLLRCAEQNPSVKHLPMVLYHWRQSAASMALNHQAKEYVYTTGLQAVRDSLKRRNINAEVRENPNLWRGHYEIIFQRQHNHGMQTIVPDPAHPDDYTATVREKIKEDTSPFILLLGKGVTPITEDGIQQLMGWMQIKDIAMVSGLMTDKHQRIKYAGMLYGREGELLIPYLDAPATEPGYMGVVRIVRNISAPNPYCVLFRRSLWHRLQGFSPDYQSPYGLLDLAVRVLRHRHGRILYIPTADFQGPEDDILQPHNQKERMVFATTWQTWLTQGDPYYNINLARRQPLYELDS